MANGKICINCYMILANAVLICDECGYPQEAFYKRENRRKEKLKLNANRQ